MNQKPSAPRRPVGFGPRGPGALRNALLVIAVFFFAGAAAGSAIGSGSAVYDVSFYVGQSMNAPAGLSGFLSLLWTTARFHLLLLALATSFLGFLVVPFVVAFRGYLISCSVASIVATGAHGSFLLSVLTVGIPALFYIPCFFVLAVDALVSSQQLALARFGPPGSRGQGDISLHLIFSLVLVLLSAAFEQLLLPRLLALFF